MTPLFHILNGHAGAPALIGSIGTTEVLIILVIALLVLGPAKLPEVARKLGKALRELRRATDDLRDGFYEDVRDVRSTLRDAEQAVRADEPGGPGAGASPSSSGDPDTGPQKATKESAAAPTLTPAADAVPVERTSSRPGAPAPEPAPPAAPPPEGEATGDPGATGDAGRSEPEPKRPDPS